MQVQGHAPTMASATNTRQTSVTRHPPAAARVLGEDTKCLAPVGGGGEDRSFKYSGLSHHGGKMF